MTPPRHATHEAQATIDICLNCPLPQCVEDGPGPYECAIYPEHTPPPRTYRPRAPGAVNPRTAASKRRYYQQNKAKLADYSKLYYQQHRQYILARQRAYDAQKQMTKRPVAQP